MPPDLDGDVRPDEEQGAAAERVRNRDRHHQAGEHDREDEKPDHDRVGIQHVRDPGGVVPGPPDDEQDEGRPARAPPGEVVEEKVRHLCDGEHEHQVVEELEVRGVLFLLGQAADGETGSSPPHRTCRRDGGVTPNPCRFHRCPSTRRQEPEMVWRWGCDVAADEPREEIAPDPRESPFELPPLERPPFADDDAKLQAIRRVIEQAERERAAAPATSEL